MNTQKLFSIIRRINIPQRIFGIVMLILGTNFMRIGFEGDKELGFCTLVCIPCGLWLLLSRDNIFRSMKNELLGRHEDE